MKIYYFFHNQIYHLFIYHLIIKLIQEKYNMLFHFIIIHLINSNFKSDFNIINPNENISDNIESILFSKSLSIIYYLNSGDI